MSCTNKFASRAEARRVAKHYNVARFDKMTAEMSDAELRECASVLASLPHRPDVAARLASVRREQHTRRELDAHFVPQIVAAT